MSREAEPFSPLLALAFEQGDAPDANRLIHAVREQVMAGHGQAENYEVLLDGRDASYVVQTVAPRLALYLKSKRFGLASCAPVFLSIFQGRTLYFISAPDFYHHIQDVLGLDEEAFATVYAGWESTGQAAAALAAQ